MDQELKQYLDGMEQRMSRQMAKVARSVRFLERQVEELLYEQDESPPTKEDAVPDKNA